MSVRIVPADLGNPTDQQSIIELLDMYSRDAMGNNNALPAETRERLIAGLRARPDALVLLARERRRDVGLCIGFEGFSTFKGQRLLNIHDIAVHPDFRNRGIGRALLASAEQAARSRDCCRITLEVRSDNTSAMHLYRSFGFVDGESPMYFWHKNLDV